MRKAFRFLVVAAFACLCAGLAVACVPKGAGHKHRFDGAETIIEATCTADGSKVVACSEPGCTEQDAQTIGIDVNAHRWNEWTTTATCEEDGKKTRTCK